MNSDTIDAMDDDYPPWEGFSDNGEFGETPDMETRVTGHGETPDVETGFRETPDVETGLGETPDMETGLGEPLDMETGLGETPDMEIGESPALQATYPPTTPLPPGPFPTLQKLIEQANEIAKTEGYAIVKNRTKKDKYGSIRKAWLSCDRGGRHGNYTPRGEKRITRTRKTGCKWEAIAIRSEKDNWEWNVRTTCSQHNHERSVYNIAHPTHRKNFMKDSVKEQIRTLSRAGVKPQQILETFFAEAEGSAPLLTIEDISNEKKRFRAEELGEYTPTQALLREFRECGVSHQPMYDNQNRLLALFFTYPWCERMLKDFPDILMLDSTYKTNRFGMPLLQYIGRTPINTRFPAAFCFLNEEDEAAYVWAVRNLKRLIDSDTGSQCDPKVVVTDNERALRLGLEEIFPGSHQILCQWHVNKNVLAKAASAWKTGDRERDKMNHQAFMSDFSKVMHSKTVQEFYDAYNALKNKYYEQEELLRYLAIHVIPHRKALVDCYTDAYLHFGTRTTTIGEGAHSELKGFLNSSTGDLKTVADRIEAWVNSCNNRFELKLGRERTRQRVAHTRDPAFQNLRNVSPFALDKLLEQYELTKATNFDADACTGLFTSSHGLPCAHTLSRLGNSPISASDVYHFWWLQIREDADDELLEVGDPILRQHRGRPSNRDLDNTTRRRPSHWEEHTTSNGRDRERARVGSNARAQEHNIEDELHREVAEANTAAITARAARGSARGTARSAARSTARSSARGSARGVTRGAARGAPRGAPRDAARGAARAGARGEA